MTTSIRHEAEVDRRIADLSAALDKAISSRNAAESSLMYSAKARKIATGRKSYKWSMTIEEARAATPDFAVYAADHARSIAKLDAAIEALSDASAALSEASAEYTGWQRFFLVPGGHIHSTTRCSTCFPTTMFGWLPDLSGLTEADAVAAHGPLLCSICFPSAPVEWRIGPVKDTSNICSGSGKPEVTNPTRPYLRYVACPDCGKMVARLASGATRSHKR